VKKMKEKNARNETPARHVATRYLHVAKRW